MSSEQLNIEVISEERLLGFASTIEASRNESDDALAARLAEVSRQLGTGIPGDQSGTGDLLRRIISRVRGLRMVKDYGTGEVSVEWLTVHAPPGGSAHLQLKKSQTGEQGIRISLAGLGYGDGIAVTAAVHDDFRERERCIALIDTFSVRLRVYAYPGDEDNPEIRCDPLERLVTKVTEWDRCPYCDPEPGAQRIIARKAGAAIDLSGDSVGRTISEELLLTGTSEAEIGVKGSVAEGLGFAVGVSCKREVSLKGILTYRFAPGGIYQPMERLLSADNPHWERLS